MATTAENQDESRCVTFLKLTQYGFLRLVTHSERLTDNELLEIKKKATWLRRISQPFHEFETVISVGLESRATTQHLIEPNTREYITDL